MQDKLITILGIVLVTFGAILLYPSEIKAQGSCGNASGFVLPVGQDNPQDRWEVPSNPFGNYLARFTGYHPGADLNLTNGADGNADLGKPVYAAGDGMVVKISPLGGLGYLVAVKHTGQFTIKQKFFSNKTASYPPDTVNTIFTIYIHINGGYDSAGKALKPPVELNQCVQKGVTLLGKVINPGFGPHLHFEVRHPNAQPSGNWSLVGPGDNWTKDKSGNTGYYADLQKMLDAGMRDPIDFVNDNGNTFSTLPDGFLDSVDCLVIRGWAVDRNHPNTKVSVGIYDGDSLITTVPADQPRTDLTTAGIGDHAFSFQTPIIFRNGQTHNVRARIVGEQVDLKNSRWSFRNACGTGPAAVIVIANGSNSAGNNGTLAVTVNSGSKATITLNGSGSSPGLGSSGVNFAWYLQPTSQPQQGSVRSVTALESSAPVFDAQLDPGSYNVSLQVRNSSGVTNTALANLIVNSTTSNSPHAALIMSSSGQTGGNGQTLNYTVSPGGSINMSFNASSSQAGNGSITGYEWRSNGTVISNASAFTFPFAAASHTISLKVTNSAGLSNTATATIIVTENTASAPHAVISMSGAGQTGTNGQTLSYSVAPGGGVTMTFNGSGSTPGTGTNSSYQWRSNGTVISTLPSFNFLFGPASHTITLKVTNSVGLSNTATATIVVSSATPAPHINSVNPNPMPPSSNPQTLTINGSGFTASATVTLRSPSQAYPNQATSSITPGQIVMPVNLGTTPAQWTVEVIDQGTSSGQFAFQVAGVNAPQINSTSPASPTRGDSDQSVQILGNNFQTGLTVTVFIPGGGTATLSGSQLQGVTASSFTMVITLNVVGQYGIRVNNPGGTQSNTFNFNVQAANPSISSISPSSPTRGDSDQGVQVFGSNFQNGLTVTIFIPGGGTATLSGSQIQSGTSGSFTMVVTLNVVGQYGIRVNNPGGAQSNTFNFNVGATNPSISSISPATPTRSDSDQNVQVFGSNFQNGLTVTIFIPGGGSATLSGSQIQSVTSGSFTMVVTLNVVGQYGIRVNNPGGAQSNTFNFNVQAGNPSISSISQSTPTRSDSNQNVQVFGSNFQSGLTVTVFIPGGGTATLSGSQIQSVTSSSFTMVVTLNVVGQYGIRVNNPGGAQSNTFNFSVQSATPSISSISPTSPTRSDSNQNVQVSGSNFQSGLTVTVFIPGGGSATLSGSQIQSVTSSSFTMVVTLNVVGQYGIRVNNPGGAQSNTFNFNVQAANPAISSISPASPVHSSSNQNVTISGSNFQSGLTVLITFPSGGSTTLSGSQIQSVTSGSFVMVVTLSTTGGWKIRVNNPDGKQSNTFNFNVQ